MAFLLFFIIHCSDQGPANLLEPLLKHPQQIASIVAKKGTPLVLGNHVLFLVRSEQGAPRLIGDHNASSERREPRENGEVMQPIPGSFWYYATAKLEPGSRIEYQLLVDGELIPDPNNPRQRQSWGRVVSELILPPQESWPELTQKPARKGKVVKKSFTSKALANTRDIHIYLPPGYNQGKRRYPTVYFNDGTAYVEEVGTPRILDYLIGKKLMKPVIAVFVDPVDRGLEYRMNAAFREMMAKEIVPMVDTTWRTLPGREARLMVGGSRGGLCATDLVINHPELFSMCAPIAPALNPMPLLDQLKTARARVSFYILGCRYDARFHQDALDLKKALEAKSWPLTYRQIPEGHNLTAWSRRIDDILLYFFGV